jgi:hypothetical protein
MPLGIVEGFHQRFTQRRVGVHIPCDLGRDGPSDPKRMVPLFEKYGISVFRPLLSLDD